MKRILLVSCFTIFLVNCGDQKRSDFVANCVSLTPGGSSYKELCECGYDRGLELMTPEEKMAYQRDFIEIQDAQYAISAPLKIAQGYAQCMQEVMQESSKN